MVLFFRSLHGLQVTQRRSPLPTMQSTLMLVRCCEFVLLLLLLAITGCPLAVTAAPADDADGSGQQQQQQQQPCRPELFAPDKKLAVHQYATGDRLRCVVFIPRNMSSACQGAEYAESWYKDGVLLKFDNSGAALSSPFLGRRQKPRQGKKRRLELYISFNTPDTAGNYTCRIVVRPSGCSGLSNPPPGCYAHEARATIEYAVGPHMHESTRELLPYYPPASLDQPGIYLSRQSMAKSREGPLYGRPTEPFLCHLVVLSGQLLGEKALLPPRVQWRQLRQKTYQPLPAAKDGGSRYTEIPPKPVTCKAADFRVFRLTHAQKASMRCYLAKLLAKRVDRETVGYYRCDAQLAGNFSSELPKRRQAVAMYFRLDIEVMPKDSGNLAPHGRLKQPSLWFNRNSTVCTGGSLHLACRVQPSRSKIRIVHRPGPSQTPQLLANYTPDSAIVIGNRSFVLSDSDQAAELSLTLTNLTSADAGSYACVAEALPDEYERYEYEELIHLTVRTNCQVGGLLVAGVPANALFAGVGIGSGLLVAAVALSIIGIFFYVKRRNEPILKRLKILQVDNSELYGRVRRHATTESSDSPLLARSSYYRQESDPPIQPLPLLVPEITVEEVRPRGVGHKSAVSLANKEVRYLIPACPVLEVPRKRIRMYRRLGEGAFGEVHAGQVAEPGGHVRDVAVKALKRDHNEEEMIALTKEMEIMKRMKKNPHPNIIQLVGVCTKDGPFLLLVELAHHGNLRDFLRERRISSSPAEYINVLPGTRQACFMPCILPQQLVRTSRDVASALNFLASIKIVHRDVAARNILVANAPGQNTIVAKLADFGLTRMTGDKDYYRVITEGKLPVKWLAPECLKNRLFSTQSDVWAYGILLYEIFSAGEIPYPGVAPSEILPHLEDGGTNPRPTYAGPEMYSLMRDCWGQEPRHRPGFVSVLNRLQAIEAGVFNDTVCP